LWRLRHGLLGTDTDVHDGHFRVHLQQRLHSRDADALCGDHELRGPDERREQLRLVQPRVYNIGRKRSSSVLEQHVRLHLQRWLYGMRCDVPRDGELANRRQQLR
jgi:hypothetical protein